MKNTSPLTPLLKERGTRADNAKRDTRSNAELALGCRNTNPLGMNEARRCFNILAARYIKPLHEYLYRILHSNPRADDVMQRTLIKAWLKLSAGNYKEEERLGKWFSTIGYHEAIAALREEKPWLHPEQMPEPPADLPDEVREEQKEILYAFIEKLPEGEKQVILLHDKEGMDYKQIGKHLGIRPSSARRNHDRAVNALKRMLGKA
ncbi:MAG: sigma-70 family RNA polymerase sigma factor [Bacteroidia bacterium]|nr:sigma-70 family RNA polymerase sigma factor [Bacteroidia bacterium]